MLGKFSENIEKGSFVREDKDGETVFKYKGSKGGIKKIKFKGNGKFLVKGKEVDLSGIGSDATVPFALFIGNDFGEAEIRFGDDDDDGDDD